MLGRVLTILYVSLAALAAEPYINYRGVVNAASFSPPGLPNGSIARGSIFTVFGRDLGPETFVTPTEFPLQTTLGGVSVTVTKGETTLDAIPTFAWNSQLSAIMPSNAPLGTVVVRVSFGGGRSNPAIVEVVESSVGVFALNSGGYGPGIVQNFVSQAEQPINTSRLTARPGQVMIAWGTGLGAAGHPDNIAPAPVDSPLAVEILVGGKPAVRRYAGRTSCCAGLDQFVFDVPADAPEGCYVPVQIRSGGGAISNAVTIAVEREGNTCSDAFNPIGNALRAGGRIGLAMPHRYESLVEPFNEDPAEVIVDKLFLALQDEPGGETWFNPLVALPPVGTCTFYGAAAGRTGPEWIALLAGPEQLDGGASADLTGPLGMASAPRQTGPPGIYEAILGKAPVLPGASPPFLSTPAVFNLSLPGGADVGAANSDFGMAAPLRWTNRGEAGLVRRGQNHTVTWTGGNAATDVVLIAGEARNTPRNSAGIFLCVAPVTGGRFTVDSNITSALPPTPDGGLSVPGEIFVGAANLRDPVRWAGPGLDAAFITSSTFGVGVLRVE